MKKKLSLGCFVFCLILCASCNRSGQATICGFVKHHNDTIVSAKVYVKYDGGFPGQDVNLYDEVATSDASGFYSFDEVPKGTHYLYGVGWDPGISDSVFGGIPVLIDHKKIDKSTDVPVTE